MDRYILVMLMGTQDRETGEYLNIPLFAKAGDLVGIRSFERMDKTEIQETPEEDYIPAGTMAVFDPDEKVFKPISLYARYKEWLDITIIASEHITSGEAEGTQDEGN